MTTTLHQWAADWGLPAAALDDLRRRVLGDLTPNNIGNRSAIVENSEGKLLEVRSLETVVQDAVRVEAAERGVLLMRNNVGAVRTATGFVRFGLANDSEAMNRVNKSSDLIGIRPVLITPAHVGCTLGQFVAREVKRAGWRFGDGDKQRETAQLNFITAVQAYGGDACFASGKGTI